MTKVELIAAVANEANLTKKDAEAAVNSALNAITNALKEGDKVALVGFGTFEVRERPARKGRNPQTGEEITIEAPSCPLSRPARPEGLCSVSNGPLRPAALLRRGGFVSKGKRLCVWINT